MLQALTSHWPEYLIEAAGLGVFMVSACLFGALLEHPESPVRRRIVSGFLRRVVMGLAMGLTAIAIIYSPWGQRSGAHINPSVTLTFLSLGKVAGWDAVFYIVAQFVGGVLGVVFSAAVLRAAIRHPAVNYVVTVPGPQGIGAAFLAEFAISFILMLVVLTVSSGSWPKLTGLAAGALVATYITLEAPVSGMSMNPARTFGSALPAMTWTALWIYFLAPPLGMLSAAQAFERIHEPGAAYCAKLDHQSGERCIHCGKQNHARE